MSKAQKKLVLTQPRVIPLDKLERSDRNVRKVKKGLTIDRLADDIDNRGLLENLGARPIYDEAGNETDRYQVTYGGRRLEALQLLVQRKRLAKDAPIPCQVRTEGVAEDDSLSENEQRLGLHPLDQLRAFERLAELEFSDDEIAARHFVTLQVVQQRRRLARVSPKLLAVYEDDGMTLRQLEAFTLSDDHARQEAVWDTIVGRYDGNHAVNLIRRALTETSVEATDPRVVFIGVKAFEAAGGYVRRDLFTEDNGGWLDDVALIERLVDEKLAAAAETVHAEGWNWVEIHSDLPYGFDDHLRQVDGAAPDLTDEQETRLAALNAEIDTLRETHGWLPRAPKEIQDRASEISAEIDAIEDQPLVYEPAEIGIAGAFVTFDEDGQLQIHRGYVREADEPSESVAVEPGADGEIPAGGDTPDASVHSKPETHAGGAALDRDDADDAEAPKPLADVLVQELTAYRTVALQDQLARNPRAAMTLLLVQLMLSSTRFSRAEGCLQVTLHRAEFPVQNPELKSSPSALAIAERKAAWQARLPQDPDELWTGIDALGDDERLQLLAHLISAGVNAVRMTVRHSYGSDRPISSADRAARAVGLDLVAAGWQPTYDNYLSRVSKSRILDAVREATDEHTAQLIDHLKKGDMAREAERLVAGTGWLPEILQTPAAEEPLVAEGEGAAVLPDFLAGDEASPEPDQAAGDDEFLAAAE